MYAGRWMILFFTITSFGVEDICKNRLLLSITLNNNRLLGKYNSFAVYQIIASLLE